MYKGILELESLNDNSMLKDFVVRKQHTEQHPEADTKIWHVRKIEVPDNAVLMTVNSISKAIKPDWHALFWNDVQVYVVFSKKIFTVTREAVRSGDYESINDYAAHHGIQKEFMDLNKVIDSW